MDWRLEFCRMMDGFSRAIIDFVGPLACAPLPVDVDAHRSDLDNDWTSRREEPEEIVEEKRREEERKREEAGFVFVFPLASFPPYVCLGVVRCAGFSFGCCLPPPYFQRLVVLLLRFAHLASLFCLVTRRLVPPSISQQL